jgi:hypothetical protein
MDSTAGRLGLAGEASLRRAPRSGSLRLLRRSAGAGVPRAAPVGGPVRCTAALVTFSVKRRVAFGQHLRVVGSAPELGAWDPAQAPALSWNDGHVWTGSVELAGDAAFKFVVYGGDGEPLWEEGDDRRLAGGEAIGITAEWQSNQHSSRRDRERERDRHDGGGSDGGSSGPSPVAAADELVLAMAGAEGRWQGKEVTFMKANEHSGSRRGGWKPEGLTGAAQRLVEGDMCVFPAGGRGGFRVPAWRASQR